MKIVATTSLPAVDRPNAERWNAARSRQLENWALWVAREFSRIFYLSSLVCLKNARNLLTLLTKVCILEQYLRESLEHLTNQAKLSNTQFNLT